MIGLGFGQAGVNAPGGRHRHQAECEDDTGDDEQRLPLNVSDVEQLLADTDAQVTQSHVNGKHPPTVARFGALVEPAFDNHKQAKGCDAA